MLINVICFTVFIIYVPRGDTILQVWGKYSYLFQSDSKEIWEVIKKSSRRSGIMCLFHYYEGRGDCPQIFGIAIACTLRLSGLRVDISSVFARFGKHCSCFLQGKNGSCNAANPQTPKLLTYETEIVTETVD